MKKLSVILSMFLLVAMTSNVYAASIFETGTWRETGQLSNGISYGIRAMTEEEKAAFESGDISQIKVAFESNDEREITPFSYSWSGNVNVPTILVYRSLTEWAVIGSLM